MYVTYLASQLLASRPEFMLSFTAVITTSHALSTVPAIDKYPDRLCLLHMSEPLNKYYLWADGSFTKIMMGRWVVHRDIESSLILPMGQWVIH